MKMDIIAGSGNDEFYIPPYAVEPIIKYVPSGSRIWCPFDTEDSYFVKKFREHGCKVAATHISNGQDFFEMTKLAKHTDFIVSNPPYSIKTEVLQELFSLDAPFAMLVGVVGLFESRKRFEIFRNNKFEIMYFNKRISYFKDYADEKPSVNPPFSSVYLCHRMLPRQIIFEEIG